MRNNQSSLVKQFSQLLLLASFAGIISCIGLFFGGQALLDKYMEHSSFIEEQANKRIEDFQSFVFRNFVSASDEETITEWGKNHSVVLMEIYRGSYLLYSTAAPDHFYTYENTEEATLYDWATYHSVLFADGEASVLIYADNMAIWKFWLIIVSAVIGIIVALFIFLSGCNRIVKQICILNDRIQLMEAGDLDVDIPVSGNHELSQLAKSLNSMRCAFKEQMEREMSIFLAHQTMITEMSHDLRTPLTTLQIYTDILRYKKYEPSMLDQHLELIDAKACQIKQLADNIFEYSLVSKQQPIQLETPAPVQQIFHDLLSEYIYQWERQGFHFEFDLNWSNTHIAVYPPYIKRSMDNISSNLAKYASKDDPVLIKTASGTDWFSLTIQNRICQTPADHESTHIGLSNIKMMMQKMNGTCQTQISEDLFSITLIFPDADKNSPSTF